MSSSAVTPPVVPAAKTAEDAPIRLAQLLDMSVVQRLAEANYRASGMPIGIVDALDGSTLVGCGWQEICVKYHRADPRSAERCRESDQFIGSHLSQTSACEYTCKNGLRDIGVPIVVAGDHLATLFLGQFFYEGETPDREFFVRQARELGWDEREYLAALDRVPVFARGVVENIVEYDRALARFIADLAEGALQHRRDEEALRASEQRKDDFLGMLSHELRNPLAPIRNSVHILDHAEPGTEQAERAKAVIGRQVEHLTRLVDDLLDVTRIARGKIELRRERMDLAELVRRTGEDHGAMMRESGLELVVDVPRDAIPIDGDATRLAQVVGNLLQNAAKFSLEGGRVTLSVARAGAAAEIRVRDTGVGIEPRLLAQLFQPFVQGERSLARTNGGLGLGLALVKGLAELHGGSVAAASDGPGKGAELTVRVPLAEAEAASAGPASPADAEPTRRARRVLIVDDNVDVAASLADLVELFGHVPEIAHDGPAALAKARATPPDVVLCDIGLPGMDGFEVARAFRADEALRGTRLYAVTGYAQPKDRRRAADAGFDGHVAKPANPDHLERLLAVS